ncbi:MAG: dihydroorotase [Muribaculaceae bacterium]
MARTLIHNALIVNEGRSFEGYVVIDGEFIAEVGEGSVPPGLSDTCDKAEDAGGAMLLPGAIDEHVHFRDPGLTYKADIATESLAAVAGGVTSFIDMPNTKPLTVTLDALDAKYRRAAECSVANYAFFIGATNNNVDTLLKCDYTRVPGVKLFLGSSTGNMLVNDEAALRRLFAEVKAVIAVHAESEAVIRANRERIVAERGEELPVGVHSEIRDARACYESTEMAVALAREYDARLHVLHISTADELRFFTPGPVAGKRITAETCPHYLLFSTDDYATLGGRIKCNPAIKGAADRDALRRAVADGRIDVVATDHAPHLLAEKEGTALTATSGMPMVQFSLPMMLTLASEGMFTSETVVERMCHAPATLFGIDRRGFIHPGYYADLAVVAPCDPYTVADADVVSRCGWTPLAGLTLRHRVRSTYVNGTRAWHDGRPDCTPNARPLRFKGV